jgi:hypothetical protein
MVTIQITTVSFWAETITLVVDNINMNVQKDAFTTVGETLVDIINQLFDEGVIRVHLRLRQLFRRCQKQ